MIIKLVVVIVAAMVVCGGVRAQQCQNYYQVFASDSCDSIAAAYRITTTALLQLNPSLNCSNLPYNQLICVPVAPIQINLICSAYYSVRAGDTCASIATAYATTSLFIQLLNPSINCAGTLTVDTAVCVAATNPSITTITTTTTTTTTPYSATGCQNYYRVYAVDSCENIAAAYSTTISVLLLLNPGLNCNSLPYFQLICVPSFSNGASTCTNYYRVFAADSCTDIANAFQTSVTILLALNPGLNCSNLPYGQYICVPRININSTTSVTTAATTTTSSVSTVAPVCQNYYVINTGDTCTNIINTFGTTLANLQALNPSLNCNSLVFGAIICVPFLAQTCGCYYTVASGDSCYTIATNNGISLTQFYSLNPGLNCFSLQVGQRVCIRATTSQTTTASSVTAAQCNVYYYIKSGDSCLSIAYNLVLQLSNLYLLNPSLNCSALQVGQAICIG